MLYFYKILNSVIHNLGDINFESHLKLHRISERKFLWRVAGGGTMIVRTVLTEGSHEHSECLQDRKWWCFLLSSICTFLMGIFSVLVVRAAAAIFCRRVSLNDQAYIAWFTSIRDHNERWDCVAHCGWIVHLFKICNCKISINKIRLGWRESKH